jgi:hypothetical protein
VGGLDDDDDECGFGTKIGRTCPVLGLIGRFMKNSILEKNKDSSKKTFELTPFLYLLQGRWWGPEGTNLSGRTWCV